MTTNDVWILIGGTGQQFGLTAGSLALIGALPPPSDVLLIDADARGECFERLVRTLDLVRAERLARAEDDHRPTTALHLDAPLSTPSLGTEYGQDPLLDAFYPARLARQSITDGFHAEPTLGAASYYPTLKRVSGSADAANRYDLASFLEDMGAPNPKNRRIFVIASAAGGTGSGLWNLVCRAICRRDGPGAREWRQSTRLLLFGPLFRIDGTQEMDGQGNRLTTDRVDKNFDAGFEYLRQVLTEPVRPFGAAYVVSYPAGANRPVAPPDRTAVRASRLNLIAASVISHDLESFTGDLYRFRADQSGTGRLDEVEFRNANGLVTTGADVRALAEAANRTFGNLAVANLSRALGGFSLFSKKKASGRVARAIARADTDRRRLTSERVRDWQGKAGDDGQNSTESLQGVAAQAQRLVTAFAQWLSEPDPYVVSLNEKDPRRVRARPWQKCLDAVVTDGAARNNPGFHVRSWLHDAAAGAIRKGQPPARTPTGKTVDFAPFKGGEGGSLGWLVVNQATAKALKPASGLDPRSFPTPMSRARWIQAELSHDSCDPAALAAAALAWRLLLAGYVRVGARLTNGLAAVASFVESNDAAGIQPLELAVEAGGVVAGTVIGAVHPDVGPFIGLSFDALGQSLAQDAAGLEAQVASLAGRALALAPPGPIVRSLTSLTTDRPPLASPGRLPVAELILRTSTMRVEHLAPPAFVDVARVEGGPRPAVGSGVRLLGFKDTAGLAIPTLLPERTLEAGLAQLCAAGLDPWPIPTVSADEIVFQRPNGTAAPLRNGSVQPQKVEWLEQVNVDVWPGNEAPAEWKFFGIAIEPPTEKPLKAMKAFVVVERSGSLVPVDLGVGPRGLQAYSWVEGRPRYLALEYRGPDDQPAIGFFPLLGRPRSQRSGTTLEVGLDLGTTRSALAVKLSTGQDRDRGFASTGHTAVAAKISASHLQRLETRSWVPRFDRVAADSYANAASGIHLTVHGSTLLRRQSSQAAPAGISAVRAPFVDFTIASDPVPSQPDALEIGNLKWQGADSDIADFLTMSFMLAVAQGDLRAKGSPPPKDVSIRMSFPLAFDNHRRRALEQAATTAAERVSGYTGARLVIAGLHSESTLATLELPESDWTLTIDIGGGTTDYALLLKHAGRAYPVLTDSLMFAGELMIDRVVRRKPAGEQEWEKRFLSHLLRHTGDTGKSMELDHPDAHRSAMILFGAIAEYGARLVAGTLSRGRRDKLPGHLAPHHATLREALSASESKPRVKVVLLGGGWRIFERPLNIDWTHGGGSVELQRFLVEPMRLRLNELSADAGLQTQSAVSLDTSFLQRNEEKTRLAFNMVNAPSAAAEQQLGSVSSGVYTICGLDLSNDARWYDDVELARAQGAGIRMSPRFPATQDPVFSGACPAANASKSGEVQTAFAQAVATAPVGGLRKSPLAAYVETVIAPMVTATRSR